jgi:hypothetical protein
LHDILIEGMQSARECTKLDAIQVDDCGGISETLRQVWGVPGSIDRDQSTLLPFVGWNEQWKMATVDCQHRRTRSSGLH